jgi:hypothetical protein
MWGALYDINVDGFRARFFDGPLPKFATAISEDAANKLKRIGYFPCGSYSSDDTAELERRIMAHPSEELSDFLSGVVGVVDANSFEALCLWKEYTEELGKPWIERSDGLMECVGELSGMPVNLSLTTAIVDGRKLLFIDAISQVVDNRLIDKWLVETMPVSAMKAPGHINRTNAMNFHNVFPKA